MMLHEYGHSKELMRAVCSARAVYRYSGTSRQFIKQLMRILFYLIVSCNRAQLVLQLLTILYQPRRSHGLEWRVFWFVTSCGLRGLMIRPACMGRRGNIRHSWLYNWTSYTGAMWGLPQGVKCVCVWGGTKWSLPRAITYAKKHPLLARTVLYSGVNFQQTRTANTEELFTERFGL